jgi:hypothetical protein
MRQYTWIGPDVVPAVGPYVHAFWAPGFALTVARPFRVCDTQKSATVTASIDANTTMNELMTIFRKINGDHKVGISGWHSTFVESFWFTSAELESWDSIETEGKKYRRRQRKIHTLIQALGDAAAFMGEILAYQAEGTTKDLSWHAAS